MVTVPQALAKTAGSAPSGETEESRQEQRKDEGSWGASLLRVVGDDPVCHRSFAFTKDIPENIRGPPHPPPEVVLIGLKVF